MIIQTTTNGFRLDMKHIFTLLFLFTITTPLFCQDRGYETFYEYSIDNTRSGLLQTCGLKELPLEYDMVEQPYFDSRNYPKVFLASKQNSVTILDEKLNVMPITGIISCSWNGGSIFVTNEENKKGVVDYEGKQIIPLKEIKDKFDLDKLSNEDTIFDFIQKGELKKKIIYNRIWQ
ncbi:hypothetical protein [Proteiniphilum sp.]|uniref:hypothetical protein n=1 Tax=Proteiniphilum sp. TaxID=1926877 RepID=UPI002B221459|nr:hypothetical protein [Proteiniphilum sp.]MEA4918689.1 hypothetical protein [Proteiniphilum sp.]